MCVIYLNISLCIAAYLISVPTHKLTYERPALNAGPFTKRPDCSTYADVPITCPAQYENTPTLILCPRDGLKREKERCMCFLNAIHAFSTRFTSEKRRMRWRVERFCHTHSYDLANDHTDHHEMWLTL